MNLPIKAEGGFKLDNITNAIIDVSIDLDLKTFPEKIDFTDNFIIRWKIEIKGWMLLCEKPRKH